MGTDDHIHLRGQPPLQFLQKQIGTEERGPDHPQADIGNRRQRPGHRIVFISRQEHRGSRLYQGMHGNVQPWVALKVSTTRLRCPEYSRGLLIRGGGTVQIDHSSTSR